MNTPTLQPGDRVTWRNEPRGGYGYVIPVDGEVVRTTTQRVVIRVPLRDGTLVERSVRPERLSPKTPLNARAGSGFNATCICCAGSLDTSIGICTYCDDHAHVLNSDGSSYTSCGLPS